MSLTKDDVVRRLTQVTDPATGRDLISAGRVRHVAVCEGYVNVALDMIEPEASVAGQLKAAVEQAVRSTGAVLDRVTVEWVGGQPPRSVKLPQPPKGATPPPASPQDAVRGQNPLPGVKHVVAVGAGKGGVGKSTVSVNLAVALARLGHQVGLLDGDIYGPSAPTLLGLADLKVTGTQQSINPFEVHGIKVVTIGKLVDPSKPLIWRGPMAHGAFRQLALQTNWGELDYLIVDLPPGTGDVPLTLAQMLPLDGAVIVCTPQKVAQDDAVRAVGMFKQLDIPVLGVVENMSYFIGDDGKEYDLFGRGGASAMAHRMSLPVLGSIPIHMALRENSDAGNPTANFDAGGALAVELDHLARRVVEEVNRHAAQRGAGQPTLSIS